MPIFGKQFRPGMGGGVEERLAALEAHVSYMQERLEFYANQNEKRMGSIQKESAANGKMG